MTRIPRADLLHGAAIVRLLSKDRELRIREDSGGFIANGTVGLWLKGTRMALPAQFTFAPEEMRDMMRLVRQVSKFYLGLVCPSDGVCCISWEQFDTMVAAGDSSAKTIMVRRPLGGSFRVKGTDRRRPLVIPRSRWGPRLVDLL